MQKNLEISLLLDFYGDLLTKKQREAVELYYNHDLSLAEIATQFNITRQGVRDFIKRAEAQLLEYEEKLGLFHRFYQIEEKIESIIATAQTIQKENQGSCYSVAIEEQAQLIIDIANNIN